VDDDERLRLEYQQSVTAFSGLTEIRFKLLALVPTVAGAVVALVPAHSSGVELLAIGFLGLVATKGVLVYELRNSQIREAAGARMVLLEREIFARGPIANVPPRKALGIGLTHTLAVAMVYGAALGGWVYLVVWGALRAFDVGHDARTAGLAAGVVAAILVALLVERLESSAW
jgi:hypothetical protein